MSQLLVPNGPNQTTAVFAKVTTGTNIKTMLQIKPFNTCSIVAWGCSFDASAAATPGMVELIDTGTVFGTVTASADADIVKYDSVENAVASIQGLTLGTSATGYTCTSEGSITVTRSFDLQLIAPTNQYVREFSLAARPKCIIGNAVRIRMHFGTAVNAACWVLLQF